MKDLKLSLRIGGVLEAGFKAAFGGAKSTIVKLGDATDMLKQRQERLGNVISKGLANPKTGQNIKALRIEYERLGASIEHAAARQKLLTENVALSGELKTQRGEIMGSIGKTTAMGVAFAAPFVLGIRQAMSAETALAGIDKTLDFKTPAAMQAFGRELDNLSKQIPLTFAELGEIAASGGSMGIAENKLIGFTQTVAKASVAWDMSADLAGESIGTLSSIYQKPIERIGELGDTINHLSNTTNAKAPQIIDTMKRIGSQAISFGLVDNQAAALAATLIDLGKTPETAGTAIDSMLQKIQLYSIGAISKQQASALGRLGLDAQTLGDNLQKSAQGGLSDFLTRINQLPNEQRLGTLVDLFGSGFASDVNLLAQNTAKYDAALGSLANTAGSMDNEFSKMSATNSNMVLLAKNNLTVIGKSVGNALLPAFNQLLVAAIPLIDKLGVWIAANPELITQVAKIGALLIGARLGFLGLKLGLNLALTGLNGVSFAMNLIGGKMTIIKAFGKYAPLITGTGKALRFVAVAVRFLGAAFLMNPIGLAITGIAIGAILIIKYWEPIKAFFTNLWDGLKNDTVGTIARIGTAIVNWSPIGLFYQAFAKVMSWFGVDLPAKFTGFGSMIIGGLISGITSKFKALGEIAGRMAAKLTFGFTKPTEIKSPSRLFRRFGQYIGVGTALGIADSTSAAEAASQNLANRVSRAQAATGQIGSGAQGGAYTIHFSPTISLGSADAGVAAQVQQGITAAATDFERRFNEMMRNQARRTFDGGFA